MRTPLDRHMADPPSVRSCRRGSLPSRCACCGPRCEPRNRRSPADHRRPRRGRPQRGRWLADPAEPADEEPPDDVKAYYESYINSLEAVSDEEYRRYRAEVWQFFSANLPVIGTVASPVIVSNRLENVLETAIFSDDLSWFKVSQPAQWFLKG